MPDIVSCAVQTSLVCAFPAQQGNGAIQRELIIFVRTSRTFTASHRYSRNFSCYYLAIYSYNRCDSEGERARWGIVSLNQDRRTWRGLND